ncbi:unnamed protein product [Cylicocyclus nassatus]|uniref:Uncharacterized protein n=1 Tax=Cylicocyclus nassatus TaxID=53992 RepID=A0AA36DK64_CYLNA|nr:unnamed protein product [Cylicocyclus nassatus]
MFEYSGEMAKDYIYAVTPFLVDAMMERDQVHRQIAIDAVAHLLLVLQYRLQALWHPARKVREPVWKVGLIEPGQFRATDELVRN